MILSRVHIHKMLRCSSQLQTCHLFQVKAGFEPTSLVKTQVSLPFRPFNLLIHDSESSIELKMILSNILLVPMLKCTTAFNKQFCWMCTLKRGIWIWSSAGAWWSSVFELIYYIHWAEALIEKCSLNTTMIYYIHWGFKWKICFKYNYVIQL